MNMRDKWINLLVRRWMFFIFFSFFVFRFQARITRGYETATVEEDLWKKGCTFCWRKMVSNILFIGEGSILARFLKIFDMFPIILSA